MTDYFIRQYKTRYDPGWAKINNCSTLRYKDSYTERWMNVIIFPILLPSLQLSILYRLLWQGRTREGWDRVKDRCFFFFVTNKLLSFLTRWCFPQTLNTSSISFVNRNGCLQPLYLPLHVHFPLYAFFYLMHKSGVSEAVEAATLHLYLDLAFICYYTIFS